MTTWIEAVRGRRSTAGRSGRRPRGHSSRPVASNSEAVAARRPLDDLADVDAARAGTPSGRPRSSRRSSVVVDHRGQPLALVDDDPEVVADLADRPLDASGVAAGARRRPGSTTSSSRRRTSFVKPTTEVSGVRSSWLTLARKVALRRARASSAAARAAWASSVASASWAVRSRDARLELAVLVLDLAVQPRVLDGRREQGADGVEQRPDRPLAPPARTSRLSTARTPTVRPLVTSGVPRNEVTSSARAKVRLRLVGILVDVAEDERPVGEGELDEVRARLVERQPDRRDERRGVSGLPPIDRPSVEDAGVLVDEQDERAVERQMADDRGERRVEELVELERRADRGGELVEGDELGEAPLELGPRSAGFLGLAGESLALALRLALPRPGASRARRAATPRTGPARPAGPSPGRSRVPPTTAVSRGGRRGPRSEPPMPTISSMGRMRADPTATRPDSARRGAGAGRPGSGPGRSPGRSARRSRSGPSDRPPRTRAARRWPRRSPRSRSPRPRSGATISDASLRSAGLERGSALTSLMIVGSPLPRPPTMPSPWPMSLSGPTGTPSGVERRRVSRSAMSRNAAPSPRIRPTSASAAWPIAATLRRPLSVSASSYTRFSSRYRSSASRARLRLSASRARRSR